MTGVCGTNKEPNDPRMLSLPSTCSTILSTALSICRARCRLVLSPPAASPPGEGKAQGGPRIQQGTTAPPLPRREETGATGEQANGPRRVTYHPSRPAAPPIRVRDEPPLHFEELILQTSHLSPQVSIFPPHLLHLLPDEGCFLQLLLQPLLIDPEALHLSPQVADLLLSSTPLI